MFLTDLRRKRLRRAARHPALTSPHVAPEGHARTATAGDSRAGPTVLATRKFSLDDALDLRAYVIHTLQRELPEESYKRVNDVCSQV